MKYCTEKMFTDLNIDPAHNVELNRLCPEFPDDYEGYKVANFFTSKVNQTSFSI